MNIVYKSSEEYAALMKPPFVIAEIVGIIIILGGIVLHGFFG